MSEYLYVCHFSNGHIKVGRSIYPAVRVAKHADRVSCLGIELLEHCFFECVGDVKGAEAGLINSCAELASDKNKNEWFVGVSYRDACALAEVHAKNVFTECIESGWAGYVKQILKHGRTQVQLAEEIGVSQPSIAKICTKKSTELSFNVGYGLLLIGRSLGIEDPACIPTKQAA
jgi:hypothetical protein